MLGNAAMIAMLLAPTANIARHDDHRIGANRVRWSIVTPWSPSRSDFKRRHTGSGSGVAYCKCPTSERARPDSNGGPAGSKPVRGGGVISAWILGNPRSPWPLLEIGTSPFFDFVLS